MDDKPWPSYQLPLRYHLIWQLARNKSTPLEKPRSGQLYTYRDDISVNDAQHWQDLRRFMLDPRTGLRRLLS